MLPPSLAATARPAVASTIEPAEMWASTVFASEFWPSEPAAVPHWLACAMPLPTETATGEETARTSTVWAGAGDVVNRSGDAEGRDRTEERAPLVHGDGVRHDPGDGVVGGVDRHRCARVDGRGVADPGVDGVLDVVRTVLELRAVVARQDRPGRGERVVGRVD